MTIFLTDHPARTACFLPAGTTWAPLDPAAPAPAAHHVQSHFNPGQPTWTATHADAETDRIIALIDHAPASQFDTALEAVKRTGGLPDRLVCLALTGTRFRGQRNRPWVAVRGNLHVTAHYKTHLPAAEAQAALTMIPSVAAVDAIIAANGNQHRPVIKWINDVWIHDAKIAGALTATTVSHDRIDSATFGIGINVASAPPVEPTVFVPRTGCLAANQTPQDTLLPRLFFALIAALDGLIEQASTGDLRGIYARYRSYAGFIGQPVTIWPEGTTNPNETIPLATGKVLDLRPDLSLLIEGRDEPVRSGRMAWINPGKNRV